MTTSINIQNAIIATNRAHCCICGNMPEIAIDLPNLPLTDTYCREPVENRFPGLDQKLLFCPNCGHGQLESQLSPAVLYGNNYCFRTSASATARKGTEFFLETLEQVAPGRHFRCVLDLGCNDLFLLNRLKDKADVRIGIDPVWLGREEEREDQTITVYGCNFDDVDFASMPAKPDLVVCRHTLEHISDPLATLGALMELAAPDALFLFEVPGFDGLLSRFRFDQVFHQHLQYFSLGSFCWMLQRVGANLLLHRENYHDWGAIAVAFSRGEANQKMEIDHQPTLANIHARYQLFRDQMRATRGVLDDLRETPLYGYGAAQMLPVLAYHLETDFSELIAVLDDDPEKDGIGYWNLPVSVRNSAMAKNLNEASVLVTAVDNVKPIMARLLSMEPRPRHILFPFHII